MTLLEKAKQSKHRERSYAVTDEHIELAIAWIKGEVTTLQACDALQTKGKESVKARISTWLKEAYKKGML